MREEERERRERRRKREEGEEGEEREKGSERMLQALKDKPVTFQGEKQSRRKYDITMTSFRPTSLHEEGSLLVVGVECPRKHVRLLQTVQENKQLSGC